MEGELNEQERKWNPPAPTWESILERIDDFGVIINSKVNEAIAAFENSFPESRLCIDYPLDAKAWLLRLRHACGYGNEPANEKTRWRIGEAMAGNEKEADRLLTSSWLASCTEQPAARITVYFPEVRVTNENGMSVDIQDLYCRIRLRVDGTMIDVPKYMRTTFPWDQAMVGYVHSHMPTLSGLSWDEWRGACYGEGPLKRIVDNLRLRSSNEAWLVFCVELQRYLEVESLAGGPYIHMGVIANGESRMRDNYEYTGIGIGTNTTTEAAVHNIALKMLEMDLVRFGYRDGRYIIAMTPFQCMAAATKAVIALWREDKRLLFRDITEEWERFTRIFGHTCTVDSQGRLGTMTGRRNEPRRWMSEMNGRHALDFKGRPVMIRILGEDAGDGPRGIWLYDNARAWHAFALLLTLANMDTEKAMKDEDDDTEWNSRDVCKCIQRHGAAGTSLHPGGDTQP